MCHWLLFFYFHPNRWVWILSIDQLSLSLPMEELSKLEFLECPSHHLGVRTFSHTLPCMTSWCKISKSSFAAKLGATYLGLVGQIHSVGSRFLGLAICQRHPCCWYKSSKSFSRRKRASSWVSGGSARGFLSCPKWWILYSWLFKPIL